MNDKIVQHVIELEMRSSLLKYNFLPLVFIIQKQTDCKRASRKRLQLMEQHLSGSKMKKQNYYLHLEVPMNIITLKVLCISDEGLLPSKGDKVTAEDRFRNLAEFEKLTLQPCDRN